MRSILLIEMRQIMSDSFVDTDVLIRLLTGDDAIKMAQANALFNRVQRGEITLAAPVTVIADAVHVLRSNKLYGVSRSEIRDLLTELVKLPHFKVENRRIVLDALDIYGSTNVDFGDAMIVATMRQIGARTIYSYDKDFNRFGDIDRITP